MTRRNRQARRPHQRGRIVGSPPGSLPTDEERMIARYTSQAVET